MLHHPLVVVDEQARRSKGLGLFLSDLLVLDGRPDRVGSTRSELTLVVDRGTAGPEVDGGRERGSAGRRKDQIALVRDVGHPSIVAEEFAACSRLWRSFPGTPLLRPHRPLPLTCHDLRVA